MTPFEILPRRAAPARPAGCLFKAVDQALAETVGPQAVHASLRGAGRQAR